MTKEKLALESEIASMVKDDNGCETHFEYQEIQRGTEDNNFIVKAITYNPLTEVSFLMCRVKAPNEISGLKVILDYVKNHRSTVYTHTITWSNKRNFTPITSYFYGKDALEALEKFYHGKNREDYLVFNVKLNPVA